MKFAFQSGVRYDNRKQWASIHKDPYGIFAACKGLRPLDPLLAVQNARLENRKKSGAEVQKRTNAIKVRLTDDELKLLNEKKTRAELARWIRETCLNENSGKKETIKYTFDPEIVRILSGIGNNLNQIARVLNTCMLTGEFKQIDLSAVLMQIISTERALELIRSEYKK